MHKSNKDECLQVDLDVEDIQSQTYSYHMDGDIDYRDGGVTRRLYENNTTSRRWHQNKRFSEAIDNVQRKSVKKHGKVSSRQMD